MTRSRHAVTLDDLDRDELLRLARRHILWRPADLIWAQWEAACDRWESAWDEYCALSDQEGAALCASVAAVNALASACRDPGHSRKALERLRRASIKAAAEHKQVQSETERARAKVDRIQRRQNALLAQHKEMRDAT